MANGKLSLEDWKELTPEVRDYHIWSKLDILDNLSGRFAGKWVEKIIVWTGISIGGAFLATLAKIVFASPK